ncbi:Serine/threonine-protein kinase PrkC [Gemmata obscuriglobus]|uniref:protein kinase domain-containing protein n=1 Tax=Gemmata obscuriglobus TaxID=114 RepID=UPI00016C4C12|nr:HDOD domain-containing protein [Gemmata obscuriglobus]QEG28810.1 Serine/threonine-protein kinase PrkC [Gemmata obscuriglobus]VTS07190.1 serine threonine protein kinase : Serine/threonine protein kinase OS=Rhodopirellula sp. SWK7 GN=RRSWK_05938 PE=3 SV=1: HDOD: Pkinase [Gemmata obscuriglobus UQM 2246]
MSASISTPPLNPLPPRHRAGRNEVLAAVLDPTRLPTAPAVALQVVNAASKSDCEPSEIVALLALDSALCGKLLRAVNSCIYGLKQPIASVARAVHVLGLNTVRSLALGLSLPAVKVGRGADQMTRDYWMSSVGGAIIARELAVLTRRSSPDDDLVAGLLRDLGELLLRQMFPDAWLRHVAYYGEGLVEDPCGAEVASFGIDHADVTAEILQQWKLPADIVEPIRYHHQPELATAASKVQQNRAELLQFSNYMVHLDRVAQNPDLLARVMMTAKERFHLPRTALVAFLQSVAPKIEAFASVLNQDIGQCPDYATVLAAGAQELVNLTVETSRTRMSGPSASHRTPAPPPSRSTARTQALPDDSTPPPTHCDVKGLPDFRPEFAKKLPECGCRLGGYELRSLLGRGAMGVVFKAFEPSLHRFVAIKVLAPELTASASARARFAREARVAASIQHENAVGIYAVREAAGVTYLAMEYVRGSCLEARVEQHGPLPVLLAVNVARQIASGLAAAHAKGVIHRDIKPANILLEDDTGRAKITDFGLARIADDAKMTADGALIGTPFFMAPETVQGEEADSRSDLFGLGGVMYHMVTGKVPFPGQTVAAVFNAVCGSEPLRPSLVRAAVPDWFEEVILRLLRKDPAARYPDAASVAAILGEYC